MSVYEVQSQAAGEDLTIAVGWLFIHRMHHS